MYPAPLPARLNNGENHSRAHTEGVVCAEILCCFRCPGSPAACSAPALAGGLRLRTGCRRRLQAGRACGGNARHCAPPRPCPPQRRTPPSLSMTHPWMRVKLKPEMRKRCRGGSAAHPELPCLHGSGGCVIVHMQDYMNTEGDAWKNIWPKQRRPPCSHAFRGAGQSPERHAGRMGEPVQKRLGRHI